MSKVTVALLVADAKKANAIQAIALLTPQYTVGFSRAVCPPTPLPTYQTPATFWYDNGENVDMDTVVSIWQNAVAGQLPAGLDLTGAPLNATQILAAVSGMKIWTAQNSTDPISWAGTNLVSETLQFVPDPPL